MNRIIITLFLLGSAPGTAQTEPRHLPTRGVYGGFPDQLLANGKPLAESGINAIWVGSDSLDRDQIERYHAQGAQVFAEFNTLHAAEFLKTHPDAAPIAPDGNPSPPPDGWQGVCPAHPEYRNNRMTAFRKTLQDFEIDGIWLDYHHAHASWEQAEPNLPDTCFCPRCLALFDSFANLNLSKLTTPEAAHLILNQHHDQWVNFRCNLLTNWIAAFKAIRDEVRPSAQIGVFHCPWSDTDRNGALRSKLFIDLKAWKPLVDVFSPMPYHARFGHAKDLDWIARQTRWLGAFLDIQGTPDEQVKIWPIVQISNWGENVPAEDIARIIQLGAQPPSSGLIAFAWGGFAKDPAKIDALTQALRTLAPNPPTAQPNRVAPVPISLRATLELSDFYQKHIDTLGFPIIASARVSDHALAEADYILRNMLANNPSLLREMAKNRVRLVIMAHNEFTTDIPEHARMQPKVYWDRRARGLGGSPTNPVVSCGEENLLHFLGDPYSTENILIHEFAHSIHLNGLRTADPTFNNRLNSAFEAARDHGLWKNTYAMSNPEEYWAEAVQSYFDTNRQNDAQHNHVDTREELQDYDPAAFALCNEVFKNAPYRYQRIEQRDPAGRAHLEHFDPAHAPHFQWRKPPIPNHPRVRVETDLGQFEITLDHSRAPQTVANFLHYVHQGAYNNGAFHRTVHADNQPHNTIKIAVIQARASEQARNSLDDPIPLERTSDTGLSHLDGTISMARDGPDTAQDEFFLCIGDQPDLDFGGQRNPDGQGFAAFGRVTRGLDVVRKIHAAPAQEQSLSPPIQIQRIIRLE